VGILSPHFKLGLAQGLVLRHPGEIRVEIHHQVTGGKVIHLPEAGKDRAGAGVEEAAGEPDHVVSLGNLAQSRLAGAERDQVGVQVEAV
jgi:hypothetical protein